MLDLDYMFDEYSEEYSEHKETIYNNCKSIIEYFLDYKGTIRMCEKEICVPRSTIHSYIYSYIKKYWYEEYLQIVKILQFNKMYRVGPKAHWKFKP